MHVDCLRYVDVLTLKRIRHLSLELIVFTSLRLLEVFN